MRRVALAAQAAPSPRAIAGLAVLAGLLAGLGLWQRFTWLPPGDTARTAAPDAESRPPGSGPELPKVLVAWAADEATQPARVVRAGEDLQKAIDGALPGDVIVLEPGAVYQGPFKLRAKAGEGWITIRTAAADGVFPPAGTRVTPAHAHLMPKIESASGSALTTEPGAHHYRFVGIEIRPRPGVFLYNLVALGGDDRDVEDLPHHVVFERCYLHGDPMVGGRRGILLHSRHTAVVDSHLADFKEPGADSQALCGWNGPGPFAILNNYLEGAGENVMFGGGDPSIKDLVPSDIEVRGNHFAKPLAWRAGEGGYRNTGWSVKNLFELKNARRVLVDGNVFEHNWAHAQSGFAILFTVRNQDGDSPWSIVEDVTFTNNIVRRAGGGVNILGRDDLNASQQARRIAIRNNLFEDISGQRWGGSGRLLQLMRGAAEVVVAHNTAMQTGPIIFAEGEPHLGFVYRDNIAPHNEYGIVGTGTGSGRGTLALYFPRADLRRNVIAGGDAPLYPEDNFFPGSLAAVGFVSPGTGDYRLSAASPYRRAATDGKDIGVDLEALMAAASGATAGRRHVAGPR